MLIVALEDDMSVSLDKKVPALIQFHEKLLQPGWNIHGCTYKDTPRVLINTSIDGTNPDEKVLAENFDKVIDVYQTFQLK